MSGAVLKCQHIGVGTDKSLVAGKGGFRKQCLNEQDDQVYRLDPLCGGDCLGMIDIVSSVFLKLKSVFIDSRDYIRVCIYKINIIM